ncbi:HPr kinase/phosphorylase [Mesorhizobium sp. BAC0120]|uniref:HPr kinase/phosphorylase n=1 Tax=Mesorhizobium sp. BAC0120 TaxID=3090670 RepID=UPI00298CFDDB|nr:HPr kinase/phosphorylase [Mesorhizobium sp. BAC0120]MDW6024520.1 HPr kinase/phosphorylase [Mesorhizobium sp. BAC0120]
MNIHATALVLGDRGVLITGASGSGKTTLALVLIRKFLLAGSFARLVADDQIFVKPRHGRVVVYSPRTIAGLAEVYGLGPQLLPHFESAVVDLVVRLVPKADAPRLSDPLTETVASIALPRLDLPSRNRTASSLAVAAWLKTPPFC